MITPEEDYETWKLIITTVTDDISSFSSLFPDLQRLLRSIEETGSLAGDLAPKTDDFAEILYPNIINPLLNFSTLDEVEVLILIETLQAIVQCCTFQISNKNAKYVEILENLFTQDQRQLYRSNTEFEIRETIINFFISIDGYQKCISAIESENENANKLGYIFNICLSCSGFLENYDSNELFDKTADAFCRVCEKDIRSFPVSVIDKIFNKIEFNSKWLSLFLILLRSDFFDKKLFSLQKISKLIENDKNKEIMIEFLNKNLDEIISIPIHSEFGSYLGAIYGFAASNNLFNIDKIKNIWQQEEFVHPSILQSFYSIFEILSNKLPETESVEYSNVIVETKKEPPTQIWFHLISTVAQNFMKNKFKDAFEILRNKIWSFAFPPKNEEDKKEMTQFEKNARRTLIDLCKYNSQQFIEKVLTSFSDIDDFCLELIQTAASGSEKLENGSSLLDLAISKLPNENAVKLISTLCIDQKVALKPEQKDLIVHNEQKEKFLEKLIFDVGFDDNDIEQYFYSLKEVKEETYYHIIKYVSTHNVFSEPLTTVPFMKEKLIWDFALKPSRVANKFQEFLCYHYSLNDGIQLTDEKMINEFFSQISNRFEISDKDLIYKLIREFIRTIEKNADIDSFGLKRHFTWFYDWHMKIVVSGFQQEFRIVFLTNASVLMYRIASILGKGPEYINLYHQGHPVTPNTMLGKLKDRRQDKLFLTYSISQTPNKIPHLRTALPTLILHRSHLMDKLIQYAKMPKFNFELKTVLDILPTYNDSNQQVMIIKKVKSYDYENNFTTEFPLFFEYNLSVLHDKMNELKKNIIQTGGFQFVVKSITKFRSETVLKEILNWIMDFRKILKDDEEKLKSKEKSNENDGDVAVLNEVDRIQISNALFENLVRVILSSGSKEIILTSLLIITNLELTIPPYDPEYSPKIIKHKRNRGGWWGHHHGGYEEGNHGGENKDVVTQASNVPLPESTENYDKADDMPSQNVPEITEGNQFEPDEELLKFFEDFADKAYDTVSSVEEGVGSTTPSQDNYENNENKEENEQKNESENEKIDESIPLSHLLADFIPTLLFSDIDSISDAGKDFLKKHEIPIEYFESILNLIDVGKTTKFLDVLSNQIKLIESHQNEEKTTTKAAPTKLIEFSINNLNLDTKYLKFSLSLLKLLIDYCTEEQKQKIVQFIKDNFFDLYRNDFESDIVNSAFEILGKVPEFLPESFSKIDNEDELKLISNADYLIDGSDFRIERQTTGLANLGMTCFLNSILQQFFAIPLLRKIIIEYTGDDDFLRELRKLFCRMRESFSAWVSPKNVADHWVNWDGTKLNVHVQQDASEFVQMLVDKISLVVNNSMFNGTLVNHIDGVHEEFHTSHTEPYSILSLPITDSTNLEECLNSLKTPNFFNDYLAESLNKKIEAKQTELIGNLPDHLIIQLKRFEFEYKTWVHRKINKTISITETIDVLNILDNNYMKNDFGVNVTTKYNLNGIVLHMGSAQGGHYFSFVRNRTTGDWFKFNDKQVTPITIQDVIKDSNGSNSNAYLLFYDRENLFEVDDSKLTKQLQDEIDQENKMSTVYRFFFTPSFTRLLSQILENEKEKVDKSLIETATLYSLSIILHLSSSINCSSIYKEIKKRIINDNEFIELILNNLHIHDFVDCTSSQAKTNYFDYILKPLTQKLSELSNTKNSLYFEKTKNVFNESFSLIDKASEKLDESNLYFRFLYRLLKIIQKQKDEYLIEIEKIISEKIENILIEKIPQHLKENPSIQPSYYYASLDLGNLMKYYRIIDISSVMIEKMKDPSFLAMLMSSKTKTKRYLSIYMKAREMNLFDVDSFFIEEFLPKESIHVSMVMLFGAMFMFLGEKAIPLTWTTKFMIKDQFYVPSDVAFMYVLLAKNQIKEDVLIKNIESWFPSLILHENYETRILAPFSISFLIRHKSFESLGSVPSKDPVNFDKAFFNVERTDNPISNEMKEKIDIVKKCIFEKCIPDVMPLIEKEIIPSLKTFQPISKYRAVSLLNLLLCLKQIKYMKNDEQVSVLDEEDENKINKFAEFIVNHSNICDSHVRHIAKLLDGKTCISFLMKVLPTHNCIPRDSAMINRVNDILDILLPLADQIPSEYVLNEFIPSYVFSKVASFAKTALKFLESFCKSVPKEELMNAIDSKFDENCNLNIAAVLFVLSKLDVKRPVLKYALRATSFDSLTRDEVIEFGFKFNEKEKTTTTTTATTKQESTANNETETEKTENESTESSSTENKVQESAIVTFDSDVATVVSLLSFNSMLKLSEDTRPYLWDFLIENCDNLPLFTSRYQFDSTIQFCSPLDFVYLSKFLKKFEQSGKLFDEVVIPSLLKMSNISFESFIENFDFLRSHEQSKSAVNTVDFIYNVFSLVFPYVESFSNYKTDGYNRQFIDINENVTFLNFCETVFNGKNSIDKISLTSPMVRNLVSKISIDNQVLNDPLDRAFSEFELIDSIVPVFKFLKRFEIKLNKEQIEKVEEFIEKIKSPKIQSILKLDKIDVLINAVSDYFKI